MVIWTWCACNFVICNFFFCRNDFVICIISINLLLIWLWCSDFFVCSRFYLCCQFFFLIKAIISKQVGMQLMILIFIFISLTKSLSLNADDTLQSYAVNELKYEQFVCFLHLATWNKSPLIVRWRRISDKIWFLLKFVRVTLSKQKQYYMILAQDEIILYN